MKINKKTKKIVIWVVAAALVAGAGYLLANRTDASTVTPESYGLQEGNLIRATGDNDIFIINQFGFKRLFLNPVIFNMYGHLGGWANVKTVAPATRDAFVTSPYYRADGDTKVYKLEQTGEDTGTLRWVNVSQSEFLANASVNQIFTINSTESNWYPKGSDVTTFGNTESNVAVKSATNLEDQTIPANASGVKVLSVDFKGSGAVNSLTVKRLGFQSDANYENIFLYKDGVRVGDPVTFSGVNNTVATFNNLGLTAPFKLDVVVNFDGATVGSPAQIELQGSYNGLPLKSNQFLFANVTDSTITFGSPAVVSDVVIGQSNAKVGEFKFSVPSGHEDITVKSVQLRNTGTADVSNVKMVVDGNTYQGLSLGDNKSLFATNFVVNDGKSKKVELFADISTTASTSEKIQFKLEKSYDVATVGNVYGFGVSVIGGGTFASSDLIDVLDGGALVASTATNKPVVALWGDTGVKLFDFKLKATDESFNIDEFGFAELASVSKLYVYDGSILVGSEPVDGSIATVSADFVLTGERTYTVKADFLNQEETASLSFTPKLIAVNATGVGSDSDKSLTNEVPGKEVHLYSSTVSVTSTLASGTFTPSVNKKVFSFDVTAFGDVKLASGSPFVTLNVETVGATATTSWELRDGSTVVASGSYNFNVSNSLEIGLSSGADPIVLTDGDSVSLSLYLNTVGFTGTNRYVGVTIENDDGIIEWLGQDNDGEWLLNQFSSVKDGVVGLPTTTVEFTE